MIRVGIVDCGISNVGSVLNAFTVQNFETQLVHRPEEIRHCSHVVLPGDGSFPVGMQRLAASGLDGAIRDAVHAGKPLLGICLGMQLLAESGSEYEPTAGLALTAGRVVQMTPDDPSLPVPQIGWNQVTFYRTTRFTTGIGEHASFYFMQSYCFADPSAPAVSGICDYGGPVVSVIEQGHIIGVQFHPEKSQRDGLKLLSNFASLA